MLIGHVPAGITSPQLHYEANFLNNANHKESKCNSTKVSFNNCLNSKNSYLSKSKLDELIVRGAIYSTKFIPLMNNSTEGSEYSRIIVNDVKSLLVDAGFDYVNTTANSEIQNIPFFAQTSINVSGGSESDTTFSLNSLMNLGELAKDDVGAIKTIVFSQARFATATNAEGTTTNLGLGIRHRPNDVSMFGANAFWDYRMTDYSNAHSRLGLGGEYFWKDFEFRNNWYMAITNEKDVTIKGTTYKEKVVDGWDVELGYRLPNNPELAFFIKGFNWDYKNTQDNSGLEGSITWQASPHIGLEAYISNEISGASTKLNSKLPSTDETFFGFRINLTGNSVNFAKRDYKKNMITQMTQPVKRQYDVLLERSPGTFQNRAKGN